MKFVNSNSSIVLRQPQFHVSSIVPPKVHAAVEVLHLIGVAIEGQCAGRLEE
jgi:hypothetical protein